MYHLNFKGVLKVLNRPFKSLKIIVSRYKFVFLSFTTITIGFIFTILMRNEGGLVHYIHVLLNTLVNARQNGDLNSILHNREFWVI